MSASEIQNISSDYVDLKIFQKQETIDNLIRLGHSQEEITNAIQGMILQLSKIDKDTIKIINSTSVYIAIRNALSLKLNCNQMSGEAYFIPYKHYNKETKITSMLLQLIIGYKAFRNKAYEYGFKIHSDVVTHGEIQSGDFKIISNDNYYHNTLNRTIKNIIPSLPQIKSKAGTDMFVKEIKEIKYNDNDICFVYAQATDLKNNITFIVKLSILEVFERSMKNIFNFETKKKEKGLADGLLINALNNNQQRDTDIISMFKKAAIRALFSELPYTKCSEYSNLIYSKENVDENNDVKDEKHNFDTNIFNSTQDTITENVAEDENNSINNLI